MNNNDNIKNESNVSTEKITLKTPNMTYSYSDSWTKNKALNDILIGLISDDFSSHMK